MHYRGKKGKNHGRLRQEVMKEAGTADEALGNALSERLHTILKIWRQPHGRSSGDKTTPQKKKCKNNNKQKELWVK